VIQNPNWVPRPVAIAIIEAKPTLQSRFNSAHSPINGKMAFFNTALQLYRVMIGAQDMADTMTDSERALVVFVTWVALPVVLAPVIYYCFIWSTGLVEKLGDIFFPERQPTKSSTAATPGASKSGNKAKNRKTE
jgi:hypothetical protein